MSSQISQSKTEIAV